MATVDPEVKTKQTGFCVCVSFSGWSFGGQFARRWARSARPTSVNLSHNHASGSQDRPMTSRRRDKSNVTCAVDRRRLLWNAIADFLARTLLQRRTGRASLWKVRRQICQFWAKRGATGRRGWVSSDFYRPF